MKNVSPKVEVLIVKFKSDPVMRGFPPSSVDWKKTITGGEWWQRPEWDLYYIFVIMWNDKCIVSDMLLLYMLNIDWVKWQKFCVSKTVVWKKVLRAKVENEMVENGWKIENNIVCLWKLVVASLPVTTLVCLMWLCLMWLIDCFWWMELAWVWL